MTKQLPDSKEALQIVLENPVISGTVKVLTEKAGGRILKENIIADRDFPPFHRVTMDGIALKFSALEKGVKHFRLQSIQMAGEAPHSLESEENCIEIMTGAQLPIGCDCIIPYEEIQRQEKEKIIGFVLLHSGQKQWQNIHLQGGDTLAGTLLTAKGKRINENDLAIAASCGYSKISVSRKPVFLIINTGNELVGVNEKPLGHQIRMSNGILLSALIKKWGGISTLEKSGDHPEEVASLISQWEDKADAIILTGAVSKGKTDFIPSMVEEKNYKILFHGVAQRPGKPFLFAVKQNKVLFGFPGNPAAVNVCARFYLHQWIHQFLSGKSFSLPKISLGEEFTFNKPLDYFLPVTLHEGLAIPEKTNGSGDLISIKNAEGYVILHRNKDHFEKGCLVDFIPF